MDFLKKHYEKLILSVVLLGLAIVAAFLPMKVNQEKEKEDQRKSELINPKIVPLAPVDLSTNQKVLAKVKAPINFDIAGRHNLFNPVTWVQKPNGEFIKVQTGNEIGIGALEVTAINPLQLVLTIDEVLPTAGAGGATEYKYQIGLLREGAGSKMARAMSKGGSDRNIGTLKDVLGPPENPTGLVITLPNRTQVTISKEKPYTEIIGYSADLFYEPSRFSRKGAKKGDPLLLGTEAYTIHNIEKDVVTFQAKSNQKTTQKRVKS